MALVNMKQMLEKAKQEKYAVGQFNINNLEWTKTILTVSEEMSSPVILGVSSGAAKYMGGFKTVVGMVKGMLEDLNITVDVAIHLDHGSSFDACKKAIDAGFTSVMIDASHHPLAEDDVVGDGIKYADVNECVQLVKEAHIDALAPALGSVHGPYKGEPVLGFKEMEEIKYATNLPLVLHGGTGIPDEKIKRAIACGTCKINVNTECQLAFARELRKLIASDDKVYDPRKIIGPATKGIADAVKEKINVFGSNGKAVK
jgi:fructose-bisphosphate aldolase class II